MEGLRLNYLRIGQVRGRYGRYVVRRFVSKARAVDQLTFRSVLMEHLGGLVHELPVTVEQ